MWEPRAEWPLWSALRVGGGGGRSRGPGVTSEGHVERGGAAQRRRRARGFQGGSRTPTEVVCECPPEIEDAQSRERLTKTGSGTSVTPKRSWTRSGTSRASATTSDAAAPPRVPMARGG